MTCAATNMETAIVTGMAIALNKVAKSRPASVRKGALPRERVGGCTDSLALLEEGGGSVSKGGHTSSSGLVGEI